MKKLLIPVSVLALSFLCACTPKPSDSDLEKGLTQAVQIKAVRMNPFASAADTKISSWKVTNQYTRGDTLVYEFEAQVHLVAKAFSDRSEIDRTLTMAVAFRKSGNRWDASPID